MNVLITGSNGFIGKNLSVFLSKEENITVIGFDKENTLEELENDIKNADFIFHLAGVNRPTEVSEFYEGNTNLTKSLVDLLNKYNKDVPLIFTSSIQAELDNDYGKSKKAAEDYLRENYKNAILFRL